MQIRPWSDPENFNAGYVMRSQHLLFKQGDREPWTHMQEHDEERSSCPRPTSTTGRSSTADPGGQHRRAGPGGVRTGRLGRGVRLLGEAPEADADVEDVERLAVAAHLAGRDHDSERAWVRAHRERLRLDHTDDAVRCAFWLAILLMLRGETARAGGWLAGAERLVDEVGCGRGYLRVPVFLAALTDGNGVAAEALACEVVEGGAALRRRGPAGAGRAGAGPGRARAR